MAFTLRLCFTLEQKFYFMIALVASFFVVEITTGYVCNSLALISDAFHMVSDLIAHAVGLAAVKISKLKSNRNTYGWVRAEVIGALVNSVFMLAVCLTIILESVERFLNLQKIERPFLLLVIGLGGLLLNIIGFLLFISGEMSPKQKLNKMAASLRHKKPTTTTTTSQIFDGEDVVVLQDDDESPQLGKIKPNKRKKSFTTSSSMNTAAVLRHVIGDALGSVIVVVMAILIWQVDADWVLYLDPTLSLCLVCAMSSSTFPLLNEASQVLMQQTPPAYASKEFLEKLSKLLSDFGVISFHDLHVWRLSGSQLNASLHVVIRDLAEFNNLSQSLRQFFHDEKIHSVTVQPEVIESLANDERRRLIPRCRLRCCCSMADESNKKKKSSKFFRKIIHAQSTSCVFDSNDDSTWTAAGQNLLLEDDTYL